MNYIKLEINKVARYDLDVIVDHLKTTLDEDPIVDYFGDVWLHCKTQKDLVSEAFCLGTVYNELEEKFDIASPFILSYHELENPVQKVVLK